jgi:hypothetical protein
MTDMNHTDKSETKLRKLNVNLSSVSNDPRDGLDLSSRPKTSRIIPNPSPEIFFDYVVSSPPHRGHQVTSEIEVFEDTKSEPPIESPLSHYRAIELGCWLLGSVLRT